MYLRRLRVDPPRTPRPPPPGSSIEGDGQSPDLRDFSSTEVPRHGPAAACRRRRLPLLAFSDDVVVVERDRLRSGGGNRPWFRTPLVAEPAGATSASKARRSAATHRARPTSRALARRSALDFAKGRDDAALSCRAGRRRRRWRGGLHLARSERAVDGFAAGGVARGEGCSRLRTNSSCSSWCRAAVPATPNAVGVGLGRTRRGISRSATR